MAGMLTKVEGTWSELRRRRVFRAMAAYVFVSWVLLQVADSTFEPMGLPDWSQRVLIISLLVGLVPAAILAWIYDWRAGRVVRTPAVETEPTAARPGSAPVPALSAPASTESVEAAGKDCIAAVAILPFSDLSPGHDQDWFCDGLAEEIIDTLCCVRGLRVASRTASFRYRDGSVDPREIGRLLGVDAILEGSVRKSGGRLRITAQLVNAHDGYHHWSETYERDLADVFAIQTQIAGRVVHSLKLSLQGPGAARATRYAPTNMAAYEYYLRGRQFAGQITQRAWRQAPAMYRRAIELDPDYAQAHAGLADILAQRILWRHARAEELLPEASAAASRALDLAPDLAEAHVAQGHIRSIAGDAAGANRAFERAIELNPELPEAYYYFGRHCFAQGDYRRAAELYSETFRLRPDYPSVLSLSSNAHQACGETDAALAVAQQALTALLHQLTIEPDNARMHYMTGQILQRLGRGSEGVPYIEEALRLHGEEFGTMYNAACFYSLHGDHDRALDLLEQSFDLGMGYPDWIEHDSDLAPLRELPRFQALMARLRP